MGRLRSRKPCPLRRAHRALQPCVAAAKARIRDGRSARSSRSPLVVSVLPRPHRFGVVEIFHTRSTSPHGWPVTVRRGQRSVLTRPGAITRISLRSRVDSRTSSPPPGQLAESGEERLTMITGTVGAFATDTLSGDLTLYATPVPTSGRSSPSCAAWPRATGCSTPTRSESRCVSNTRPSARGSRRRFRGRDHGEGNPVVEVAEQMLTVGSRSGVALHHCRSSGHRRQTKAVWRSSVRRGCRPGDVGRDVLNGGDKRSIRRPASRPTRSRYGWSWWACRARGLPSVSRPSGSATTVALARRRSSGRSRAARLGREPEASSSPRSAASARTRGWTGRTTGRSSPASASMIDASRCGSSVFSARWMVAST